MQNGTKLAEKFRVSISEEVADIGDTIFQHYMTLYATFRGKSAPPF